MIKTHNGHVEIEGTVNTVLADYAFISHALADKVSVHTLFKGFILGTEDSTDDDMIAAVNGYVVIPDDAKHCTLNLAFILNAITSEHSENAENIIKTAADIAMIIKRDEEVKNIGKIGDKVMKLLEGVEDV